MGIFTVLSRLFFLLAGVKSQRIEIEKGLTENKSFAEIARIISKEPSTISKEARRHAQVKERLDLGYTNQPYVNRKNCKLSCLYSENCGTLCKICQKLGIRCIDVYPNYQTAECDKVIAYQ